VSNNSIIHNLVGYIVGKGKYKLIENLGQGDFGVTYLANELEYDSQVAIKILKDNDDEGWKDEPRRAITLRGVPQIATVIEADEETINVNGQDVSLRFIVSEYVNGKSLTDVLKDNPVSTDMIVDLTEEICKAIGNMQRRNLRHGDLNLDNIFLLSPDDLDPAKRHTVKIIDFGLSRTHKRPQSDSDVADLRIILLDCWNLNQRYYDQKLPAKDKKFQDLLWNLINRMGDVIIEQRITKPKDIIDQIYKIKHESSLTKHL